MVAHCCHEKTIFFLIIYLFFVSLFVSFSMFFLNKKILTKKLKINNDPLLPKQQPSSQFFKNVRNIFFIYENCQLKNYKNKNQLRIVVVHCSQNSSLASILFAVKNSFLRFLNVYSKRKNKNQICAIAANAVTLTQTRLQRLFTFQHCWKKVAALSYIEKIKIYGGEVTQLSVFLVQ